MGETYEPSAKAMNGRPRPPVVTLVVGVLARGLC